MATCAQMKKGEIYACPDCGVELQVIKECADEGKCAVHQCTLTCCDRPLELIGDAVSAIELGGRGRGLTARAGGNGPLRG